MHKSGKTKRNRKDHFTPSVIMERTGKKVLLFHLVIWPLIFLNSLREESQKLSNRNQGSKCVSSKRKPQQA